MKKSLLLMYMLFLGFAGFTQITFEKKIAGKVTDYGYSVAQTYDGGYIISGETAPNLVDSEIWLIKTNEYGDTTWTKTLGGGSSYCVIQTRDSGYVIVGVCVYNVRLIKTNHLGDTLWTKTYSDLSVGLSVVQTYDGGYVITGYKVIDNNFKDDVYLIKTDSVGNIIWERTYGDIGNDIGRYVVQTSDSGFVITGCKSGLSYQLSSVYLIKTNNNGDTLWTKTYPGLGYSHGESLLITNDGGYIIVGTTSSQIYIIRTDAYGDTIWTNTIGGKCVDIGTSIAPSNDGGYLITGGTNCSNYNEWDLLLLKIDANGDSVWLKYFGDIYQDVGNCIKQTADGGFIIVGSTENAVYGYMDVYLIKTDPYGTVGIEFNKFPSQSITLFSNPFNLSTQINLSQTYQNISLEVYDIQGKLMDIMQYENCSQIQFYRNNLATGLYFLKITLANKSVETVKLVICD